MIADEKIEGFDRTAIVYSDSESQQEWVSTRRSLQKQFDIDLPETWRIDRETWDKFRQLTPKSVTATQLKTALIRNGYVGLTPTQIKTIWGDDLTVPERGDTWTHIRVIFYQTPFGVWHEYGNGLPYARVRLPNENASNAKYLSPRGSGSQIFFPYKVKAFCKHDASEAWASTPEGDDSYARRGKWILTEGEDKALISCLWGHPCIGIAGVEMGKRNGKINPWLLDFAVRIERLTVIFDSDIFKKPQVFAALSRLVKEFERHLVELAKIIKDVSRIQPIDYCQEIWGDVADLAWANVCGMAIAHREICYQYLPPSDVKGLDDVLAASQGDWLPGLLDESPRCFVIDVKPPDSDKAKENTVKVSRLLTEPSKFGLTRQKVDPIEANAIALSRGNLTAGWLQLNNWRLVSNSDPYRWDNESETWQPSHVRNVAHFAINQWSRLAPTKKTLDGIPSVVDAEMAKFGSIEPNIGTNGCRYVGVQGGDFNTKTGQLEPIDPPHHCFRRVNVRPVEGKPTRFMEFYADRLVGGMGDMERFISLWAMFVRAPGKVHAIGWLTGKSGAGKSTLMSLTSSVLQGWVYQSGLQNLLESSDASRGCLPTACLGSSVVYDDDFKGSLSHRMVATMNRIATNANVEFKAMQKDWISLPPNFGLCFISNHTPTPSSHDTEGIARRLQKFEFKPIKMTEADVDHAKAIVEDEAGKLLYYILNKPLDQACQELIDYSNSSQGSIESALNSNHTSDWVQDFHGWATQYLRTLPDGDWLGESNAEIVTIHCNGKFSAGRFSKDLPEKQSNNPPWHGHNFLPDLFVINKRGSCVAICSQASRWQIAIENYEKEQHNPNAVKRGARTLYATLEGAIESLASSEDGYDGLCLESGVYVQASKTRIQKGWAINLLV